MAADYIFNRSRRQPSPSRPPPITAKVSSTKLLRRVKHFLDINSLLHLKADILVWFMIGSVSAMEFVLSKSSWLLAILYYTAPMQRQWHYFFMAARSDRILVDSSLGKRDRPRGQMLSVLIASMH